MLRFFRRRQQEAEMAEEIRSHLEARAADLVRAGRSPAEAQRQARLEFGSTERYKEECRASLGYRVYDELRGDLRYAFRGMRRQPGFTLAAVAILALATSVNTAFFSLFNNYALKPLAIRHADRHFDLLPMNAQHEPLHGFTKSEWQALEQGAATLVEGLYTSGTWTAQAILGEGAAAERRAITITVASPKYFPLLGSQTALGRALNAGDEREPVAVLSEVGWRRLFQSRHDVLGRTVRLRNTVFTVVGVTRPGFAGPQPVASDLWVPLAFRAAILDQSAAQSHDQLSGLLQPGATFAQAEAALSAVAAHFPREKTARVATVGLKPRATPIAADDADTAPVSAVLFTVFLSVLLIACANLANLHLARATARSSEIAMRLSLGASRGRIVRQLLTESLVLALAGSALGLALASAGLSSLEQYLWSSAATLGITVLPAGLDWRVFLYAVALGGLAALTFGLLPAFEATRAVTQQKSLHALTARARPRRLRHLLIGAQVAFSLVLLLMAGILVRHLQQYDRVDFGYRLDPLFHLDDQPAPAQFAALKLQPWLASASAVSHVPILYGRLPEVDATVNGQKIKSGYRYVDENYFATLNVGLRAGRMFTPAETKVRARLAVISIATARHFWPRQTPDSVIGRSFDLERPEDVKVKGTYEVVGVAPDVISGRPFEGVDQTSLYLPAAAGDAAVNSVLVRAHGSPAAGRAGLLSLCVAQGSGCEAVALRDLASLVRFPFQAAAVIAAALGLLALALTGIGLHGVVRYLVVQREREIGVRMALGAAPARIVRWILSESTWCVGVGVLVGLPIALALSQLAASSVLRIQAFDPLAYAGVPLLLVGTALLACALPAWRAARVDPIASLRQE